MSCLKRCLVLRLRNRHWLASNGADTIRSCALCNYTYGRDSSNILPARLPVYSMGALAVMDREGMDREHLELTKFEGLKPQLTSTWVDEAWSTVKDSQELLVVPAVVAGLTILPPLLKRGLTAMGMGVEATSAGTVSLAERVGAIKHYPDYQNPIPFVPQKPTIIPVSSQFQPGESVVQWVDVEGAHRGFMMHVPKSYDPQKGAPLVVAMEGFLVKSPNPYRGMAETNGINEQSEKLGFVAMYPVPKPRYGGTVFTWNEPDGATNFLDIRDYSDNKYIRAAMDRVMNSMKIDNSNLYGIGFSQGALQLHSLLNTFEPGTFKAIATVAGTTSEKVALPGAGTRLLVIHSKADPTLPYSGGTGFLPGFIDRMGWGLAKDSKPFLQVENYLKANNISSAPVQRAFPEFNVKTWTKAGEHAPLIQEYMLHERYGHTFPGRENRERETLFSVVNGAIAPPQVLDAKRVITEDFFSLPKLGRRAG